MNIEALSFFDCFNITPIKRKAIRPLLALTAEFH